MNTSVLRATIQRRILVNYRVDPDVLAALLPKPFRPATVDGFGIAGMCLIRLGDIRPASLPARFGVTTENAAHRVAVRWDTADGPITGVYIPRRDTSSRLAARFGRRMFPVRQHHARFRVQESPGRFFVQVASDDGEVVVQVAARTTDAMPLGSVFDSLEAASAFFRGAPVSYAATPSRGVFDGVALGTDEWRIEPLALDEARSSLFDDGSRFPAGSAEVDSAFLMGGLATTWQPVDRLVAAS